MITNDPQNHFLQISGIRTHISRLGAGKPLVLVHGLGGPLMWQRVVVPLAQSFDIITIDLPGFGESDSPTHNFSTQEYADFLLATLDRLDIQRQRSPASPTADKFAHTLHTNIQYVPNASSSSPPPA